MRRYSSSKSVLAVYRPCNPGQSCSRVRLLPRVMLRRQAQTCMKTRGYRRDRTAWTVKIVGVKVKRTRTLARWARERHDALARAGRISGSTSTIIRLATIDVTNNRDRYDGETKDKSTTRTKVQQQSTLGSWQSHRISSTSSHTSQPSTQFFGRMALDTLEQETYRASSLGFSRSTRPTEITRTRKGNLLRRSRVSHVSLQN